MRVVAIPSPSLDLRAAVVGLVTVVAANFLYLSGLRQILDPMMSMDPIYIRMAQSSIASILTAEAAWGPLYALWLKPLVSVFGDPVTVYVANFYALSLGISVVIYLHLLLLTRRAVPAAAAALFFIVSDLNVPLSSKVSGFALMMALAGLTVAQLFTAKARRASVGAFGVVLASYARPELYPAAICMAATALWYGYRNEGGVRRSELVWSIAVFAGILLLAVSVGAPTYGSSRFFAAFREHFAWNWSRWHGEGGTFLSIWAQAFGEANSIAQAVLQNPGAIARHLFDNLAGTASFLVASAFDHYPLLVPADQTLLVSVENLVVAAGAFGSLLYVARDHDLRQRMYRYADVLISYATLALFSLASATVIFPVPHYLVIPGVLLMVTTALAANVIVPSQSEYSWRWRIAAALLCLAAMPKPFVLPSAYEVPGSPFKGRISVERKVVDTIDQIRSLHLPPPVHVLTSTDGIGELLGAGFREVKVWQKGARPLQDFMRDNDIAVIINLEGGRKSFSFADPYWESLHNDPRAAGFVRVPIPDHERVHVFVRSDLMPR